MLATKLEVVRSNGSKNNTYNEVKRFAVEGLSDLIRVLMENVDDALFELSDKVDNDRERNQYFKAMREVRLKRDAIKREFDQEIQDCFGRVARGKSATKTSEVDEDDTELTLLEHDDLEDNIAISNMISRARPQVENELLAVTERLKLVLKRDSLEAGENPLDPKAICDCFHNASELLETDIQVKLIFYKLFERYVINNLGQFYREVNQLLIDKGVLPGFKADQSRTRQTTHFMANRIGKASPSTTFDAIPAVGMTDTAEGNLFATLQQAISGTAVDGTSPSSGHYATGSASHFSSGDFVTALNNLQSVSLANQPPSEAVIAIDPQNAGFGMEIEFRNLAGKIEIAADLGVQIFAQNVGLVDVALCPVALERGLERNRTRIARQRGPQPLRQPPN